MAKHDFGIIDCFEKDKWYSEYQPEKYNCILVDDDLLEELIRDYFQQFMKIKTYYQIATQPGYGLDYCGVTIIPPDSLKEFLAIVTKANREEPGLQLLIRKISDAINENKYLIHYGI